MTRNIPRGVESCFGSGILILSKYPDFYLERNREKIRNWTFTTQEEKVLSWGNGFFWGLLFS